MCYLRFTTGPGGRGPRLGPHPRRGFTGGHPPLPATAPSHRLTSRAARFCRFTAYFGDSEGGEAEKALEGTKGPWGEGARRSRAPREGRAGPRSPHRSSPPPQSPTPAPIQTPTPVPNRSPRRGAGAGAGPAAWPAWPCCCGAQALGSRKAGAEGAAAGRRGARSGAARLPALRPGERRGSAWPCRFPRGRDPRTGPGGGPWARPGRGQHRLRVCGDRSAAEVSRRESGYVVPARGETRGEAVLRGEGPGEGSRARRDVWRAGGGNVLGLPSPESWQPRDSLFVLLVSPALKEIHCSRKVIRTLAGLKIHLGTLRGSVGVR